LALYDQLRREVDEMRTGSAKSGGVERGTARHNAAPPPRRRFEPAMPKDYLTCDQLRTDLQQQITGTKPAEAAEIVTPYYVDKY
jgi:hypothetical protein